MIKKTHTVCALMVAFMLGTIATTVLSGCQQREQPAAASNATTPAEGEPLADAAAVADADLDLQAAIDPTVADPQEAAEPSPAASDEAADEQPMEEQTAEEQAAEEQAAEEQTAEEHPAVDKSANAEIKPGDWPQWGGTTYRNNTPVGTNPPLDWDIGEFDRQTGEWIPGSGRNIKWVAQLGSQTYGNPVVAGGRVFVGTNNGAGYLPRYPADVDLGCLLAFNEADGKFLWQHSSEKLPTGRVHDWPLQGICCSPLVEGDRLWFVTSRGEVRCLATAGYYDGEDQGPVQNEWARLFDLVRNEDAEQDQVGPALAALKEGQLTDELREAFAAAGVELPEQVTVEENGQSWRATAAIGESERQFRLQTQGPRLSVFKQVTPDDKHEADTIWVFNMMEELGVSQHNMASCSVTALGDILFVNTSNGLDESHINLPAPDAPSFIAMDKNSGEVLWTDKSPGRNILHGQWSSPTVGTLGGVDQVIFAAGDGWVYSFRADGGQEGNPDLLWKFDANPKESKWILGGRGTRNNIIATPVIYDGLVYVAVGQDPEHGEGVGHLWCIDPTRRGDVSPTLAVHVSDRSKPIPHKRLQAVVEEEGEVAVDNPNSAVVWHYSEYDQDGDGQIDFEETMHRSIGTVAIKNDLLFVADFSGLVHCVDAKTGKPHWTYDMLAASWGSPLIVEDKVYLGDEDGDLCIFELSPEPHEPVVEINMGSSVYSTPVFANGVLYISTKNYLFAIQEQVEAAE